MLPLDVFCSKAACAAPGRVFFIAVCAGPDSVCLSVLQQSVLPKVSGLEQLVLHLETPGCAVPGGVVRPTAAFAAPVLFCCTCTVSLCCTWTCQELFMRLGCLSTRACACASCQKEPVRHLCVSVHKSFVLHLDQSVYKSLCCTYACPSTRAFVQHLDVSVFKSMSCTCAFCPKRAYILHLCVSVHKSFVLHLDVSAYKSQAPFSTSVGINSKQFFCSFGVFQSRCVFSGYFNTC
jgi:hypothetical protein